ncbi:cortexin domain-containing 1 protein-like [Periophthalmus magnuspinnatus]|uniref:cortexin domain-containing 1 protein-like n=1 Tax=Periophthalmus magnuspinnatus TaxID=409849 RepID=UPI002436C197|nr:cortexin domain-containing 1 protein-like [Periophthalmus magnuspinnatus]
MDPPTVPSTRLEVDVDLGFVLFFFSLLCFFLLVTIVRCAQMVLDPYSAISTTTYQEEQTEDS